MPKIKRKNIPTTTYNRICANCFECSRSYCIQYNIVAIPGGYIPSYNHRDIIELSEKDFPTNREWLESLSDDDLAKVIACGELPINPNSFGMSVSMIKKWFSQPCKYLMEEE